MANRFYFYFAVITHPILVPPLFMLVTSLRFAWAREGLLLLFCVALPVMLLKLLKVNFRMPDLPQRRTIYAVVGLCYLLAYLIVPDPWIYKSILAVWILLMLVLWALNFRFKVSWHALAWGFALAVTGLFTGNTAYEMQILLSPEVRVALVLLIGFFVMRVRYLQKAHTATELIIGYALGLFLCNLSFLLYDII